MVGAKPGSVYVLSPLVESECEYTGSVEQSLVSYALNSIDPVSPSGVSERTAESVMVAPTRTDAVAVVTIEVAGLVTTDDSLGAPHALSAPSVCVLASPEYAAVQ